MPRANGGRRAVRVVAAAIAIVAGPGCGQEGPIAPLSSYPCHVGWQLILAARYHGIDYYFETMDDGASILSPQPTRVELGDSLDIALVREDILIDPTGTSCVVSQSFLSTPWTLIANDPTGVLAITQSAGATPATVRGAKFGSLRVRGVVGADTVGPATIAVVPRVAALVFTPSDTVDVGAAPFTVRITARDSAGQGIPLYGDRARWAVLQSSTIPVALWPTVTMSAPPISTSLNATITFPTAAVTGTALVRFSTPHASKTLTVTIPPP
jgi:hypothetical protein